MAGENEIIGPQQKAAPLIDTARPDIPYTFSKVARLELQALTPCKNKRLLLAVQEQDMLGRRAMKL
jgi:hypothetical protein